MAGVIICLFAGGLYAANIKVVGPCFKKPVFEKDFKIKNFKDSATKISIEIFKDNGIAYQGDEDGFTSILNTPSGAEAIEMVSRGKMRFYGWCFSVNGVLPQTMPSAFYFSNASDKITWFYGYSTFDNGKWTDSCQPSYKIKAPQFCSAKAIEVKEKLFLDIDKKSIEALVYRRLVDFSAEIWVK